MPRVPRPPTAFLIVAASTLFALAAPRAHAQVGGDGQDTPPPSNTDVWSDGAAQDPWAYDRPDLRLVADFSFFTGSQTVGGMDADYFGMGLVVDGHIRLYEELYLDLAWGFAHGSFSIPSDTFPLGGGSTQVGNPYLGASYFIDARPVRMEFGLGLTIPVANAPDTSDPANLDNLAGSLAGQLVTRIEGNVRPWLYLPDTFSVVARGRVESVGPLLLAADLVVAPMFPTSGTGVYDGDTAFILVPAAEIGWRPLPSLALGVRGQVAAFPTQPDETLGSLEPFVEAARKGVGFFRLGFLVQLGGPNGTTFDDDGLWGLRLTAGILF